MNWNTSYSIIYTERVTRKSIINPGGSINIEDGYLYKVESNGAIFDLFILASNSADAINEKIDIVVAILNGKTSNL